MIGGFALVAAPAEYKVTSVRTFMVSHGGVVCEKDLGPKTLDDLLHALRSRVSMEYVLYVCLSGDYGGAAL